MKRIEQFKMENKTTRNFKIIPAQPGWFVVTPVMDKETFTKVTRLHKEPVIAWSLEIEVSKNTDNSPFLCPDPITAEGNPENAVLKNPNGTFVVPFVAHMDDEMTVLRYFQESENE